MFSLLWINTVHGQLIPGDLAIIGHNNDDQSWSWIALTPIPAGEEIYFTDKGWTGTAWMPTSETHLLYTAPVGGLSCGTIVSFTESSPGVITTSTGSLTTASGPAWSTLSGDQILVYQSTTGVEPLIPTFITGLHSDYNAADFDGGTNWNTGSTSDPERSALPSGLTNETNCLSLFPGGPEFDNMKYTGSLSGTLSAVRASIMNPANWSSNNGSPYAIQATDYPLPALSDCCPGPSITACQTDLSVFTDASCNYSLGDFTSSLTATDPCLAGLSYTQDPLAGTVLGPGVYTIDLIATDGLGNDDSCSFSLTVTTGISTVSVNCGDSFIGQTTFGGNDDGDGYDCASTATPGEDIFYEVTVSSATTSVINITLDNVSDADNTHANVFWLESTCPTALSCVSEHQFNIADQAFEGAGFNGLNLPVSGPGTYWLVVDSETDGIDSYDIIFDCIASSTTFDEDGCGSDTDNDGVYTTVDETTDLLVEACESVTICNEIYVQNEGGGEWLDTVDFVLGPCYTAVTNLVPDAPGPNGFYNAGGEWDGTYSSASNTITWGFDYSGINPWGDGTGSLYNCRTYEFCFDAQITEGCLNNDSLFIGIKIGDDQINGLSGDTGPAFDILSMSDILLVDTIDLGFTYGSITYCQNEADPTPIVDQIGGVFSGTAGLIINPSDGTIDLSASTAGPHTITYTSGSCALDSLFDLTIVDNDSVNSFGYGSTLFCVGDTDPLPLFGIGTTTGGTFSATPAGLSINPTSGIIDIASSATGILYTVKYLTLGPCPDSITTTVQIEANDVVNTFDYSGSPYCGNASDPGPSIGAGTTLGGTYSGSGGIVVNPGTGVVDLDASPSGIYTIKYVTPGLCPDSVETSIEILPVDSALFDYGGTTVFCLDSSKIVPTIYGATGGIFTATPSSGIDIYIGTGEIDLQLPTTPGNFWIHYNTIGSTCPHIDSIELTFIPEDTATFSYATSYCQEDTDPFATIILGTTTSGGTFSATPAGMTINPTNGLIDLDLSLPGIYTIKYLTPGPCPDSSVQSVTIFAEDDAGWSYEDIFFCSAHSDPILPTVNTPGGIFSTSDPISVNPFTGQINLGTSTPGGPYAITYTTPGPACSNDSTLFVSISSSENPTFEYVPDTICTNSSSNPIPSGVVSIGGTWSEASGGIVFVDPMTGEVDLGSSSAGDYLIKYVTTGICPDSTEVIFRIDSLPDPVFWLPDTVCLPEANINMNDSVNISPWMNHYFYSSGTDLAVLTGAENQVFEYGLSGAGNYEITHVVQNGSCADSISLVVTLESASFAFNLLPDTLCEAGGIYNLNEYFDSFTSEGGVWNGTGVFDDSLLNPAGLGGGSYDYSYSVGEGICSDTYSKSVYIGTDVDSSWNSPLVLCASSEIINLADSVSGTTGGVFSGLGISSDTLFDPSLSGVGIIEITYTVGDTGCLESLMQTIDVLADPIANAGTDDEACGLSYSLSGSSSNGIATWFTEDGTFSDASDSSAILTVNSYADHWIYWTNDQSGTCSATDSILITFYEEPTSNAGVDQTLGFVFETNLEAEIPLNGSGVWEVVSGNGVFLDETDPTTLVEELNQGANHFDWVVTNGNCPPARDQVIIMVGDLFVPQAITPNGDGKNDFFEIRGIETQENTVKIFNRWGQLIYEAENYQNNWNGNDKNGKPLGEDTYFYVITVNNEKSYEGYVVLKK